MRAPTARLMRECAALAWYADGARTDRMLAEALRGERRRLLRRCRQRGIDPERALAGVPRPPIPMPNLRPPGPVVDGFNDG